MAAGDIYLGFDFSTQQIKAIAVDARLAVTTEYSVAFDELPHYGARGGVLIGNGGDEDSGSDGDGGLTVTSPTLMWVEALDTLLDRMRRAGFPFSRVRALSGAGQQHGSVYWRRGVAAAALAALDPARTLRDQLGDAFAVPLSPIWMDSSTTEQCRRLEQAAGGAARLADLTGSRAYERFTGNQIAKIAQAAATTAAYRDTERISLVSSFAATLFLGRYAPIDTSDGSGMNLMNLRTRAWEPSLLEACAELGGGAELAAKLGGDPVPSDTVLGAVAPYHVDRYGFSPECRVVAFTGDNPSSLAGMRLHAGDVALSLGTSDTLFLSLRDARPSLEGHVFANPVDAGAQMALLCFKNGSRARERVRDRRAGGNWRRFDELLDATPPGNDGRLGVYFYDEEITPHGARGVFRCRACGDDDVVDDASDVCAIVEGRLLANRTIDENRGVRFGSSGGDDVKPAGESELDDASVVRAVVEGQLLAKHAIDENRGVRFGGGGGVDDIEPAGESEFNDAAEVRAVIEGQLLAKRAHAENLGFRFGGGGDDRCRIFATGGASSNRRILQVMADVFGAPVYVQNVANSAALGAAYRAAHAVAAAGAAPPPTFADFVACGAAEGFCCAATPSADAVDAYERLLPRYRKLEQLAAAK